MVIAQKQKKNADFSFPTDFMETPQKKNIIVYPPSFIKKIFKKGVIFTGIFDVTIFRQNVRT